MTTKNYFKIPMLLTTIGLLTSCSNNNDWNKFGLNGKVKTFSEHYYKAKKAFGEWTNGDIDYYYDHIRVYFDNRGNYQWIDYLDYSDDLSGKLIPKRENGEIIEEVRYDEDGELISKVEIIHNSKDELESVQYNKDGKKTIHVKTYFANNRAIKKQYQIFKDNKIKEEYTVIFEYDKGGNWENQKQIDKNGKITYFFRFEYLEFDEHKNWTKALVYDSEEGKEPKNIAIREYEYY
jgi:hypothetical protein